MYFNPITQETEQADVCEIEDSQGYTVKPCLKKHKEKKGALIMSNKDKHEILLGDFVPF